jgi:arylsulfatase A-like enzyme
MARDSRYKLIWYPKVVQYQLFDLQTDPDEQHNLAGRPEFAERLKLMKQLLAKLQDEFGDAGPRPK